MTRAVRFAALLSVLAVPATAQQPARGATIAGTVRDSAAQPVPGADIVAQPGNHRMRADSAGNFMFTGLDGGNYVVAARKIGYAPERWDLKVSKNGRIDVKFVLARRMQLDTIVVTARHECHAFSVAGFMCRKRSGGGVFLDYTDIDEKRVLWTADLFKDIEGFRVDLRRTPYGPVPVPVRKGFGCVTSLVDGHPLTGANPVPTNPSDLSALEVYLKPDSVPQPYKRYTWPQSGVTRSGRCSVIVYWTVWAPYEAKRR